MNSAEARAEARLALQMSLLSRRSDSSQAFDRAALAAGGPLFGSAAMSKASVRNNSLALKL